MAHQPQRIDFEQLESDLRGVFERVRTQKEPVLVARNGVTFRLELDEPADIWQGYDPVEAERALRASQGMFAGADREEFLRDMHELREQGPNRFD